jgi:hypothetical protein
MLNNKIEMLKNNIPFTDAYDFIPVLKNSHCKGIFTDKKQIDSSRILNEVNLPSYLALHFVTVLPLLEKIMNLEYQSEQLLENDNQPELTEQLHKILSEWLNVTFLITMLELFDDDNIPSKELIHALNDKTQRLTDEEKKTCFVPKNPNTSINNYRLVCAYWTSVMGGIFALLFDKKIFHTIREDKIAIYRTFNNRFFGSYIENEFSEKQPEEKKFGILVSKKEEFLQDPYIRYLVFRNYKMERLLNYVRSSKLSDIELQLNEFLKQIDATARKPNPNYESLANKLETIEMPYEEEEVRYDYETFRSVVLTSIGSATKTLKKETGDLSDQRKQKEPARASDSFHSVILTSQGEINTATLSSINNKKTACSNILSFFIPKNNSLETKMPSPLGLGKVIY